MKDPDYYAKQAMHFIKALKAQNVDVLLAAQIASAVRSAMLDAFEAGAVWENPRVGQEARDYAAKILGYESQSIGGKS